MIVLDRKTGWIQAFPAPTMSAEEVKMAFERFLGPGVKPGHVYTDGSGEFQKACEELQFLNDASTPHRPQTNGVAERVVRGVKEGTSCTLVQSGFHSDWWAEAQLC